jgi:hypothetical protein
VRPRRRPRRVAAGLSLVVALGAGLTACGQSGGTVQARQACTYIGRSLSLLQQAARSDGSVATSLRERAYLQLREALPLAAEAADANGQWQALMTTVSESNRVPEQYLVTALRAQCAVANASVGGEPPPPSSAPPPAPVSSAP